MDEGTLGIIQLVLISIVISSALHIFYKNYINASFISGILSITIFLIYAHIVSGPEKFIGIAFIIGGLLSTSIAFATGGIIYAIKKYSLRK